MQALHVYVQNAHKIGLLWKFLFLQFSIKGMSGGFCKHFLRSFLLCWLCYMPSHLPVNMFKFTSKDIPSFMSQYFSLDRIFSANLTWLILCIFRICYSIFILNSVLLSPVHWIHHWVFQVVTICFIYFFFNLCGTVHRNNSVTDEITYVYQALATLPHH